MSNYAKYKDLEGYEKDPVVNTTNNKTISPVISIVDSNHKDFLIQNNKIVLVDIYADWCKPCKHIKPNYILMANKYTKNNFCVLADENVDYNISPDVSGVPTFQFFVNGKLEHVIVGADINRVENKLIELIKSNY